MPSAPPRSPITSAAPAAIVERREDQLGARGADVADAASQAHRGRARLVGSRLAVGAELELGRERAGFDHGVGRLEDRTIGIDAEVAELLRLRGAGGAVLIGGLVHGGEAENSGKDS